jgi:AraC family transcriptional regulator
MNATSSIVYDLDAKAETSGVRVEVRRYSGIPQGETFTVEQRDTVGLTLTPRPPIFRARYQEDISGGAYAPVGPAIFRPRNIPWVVEMTGGSLTTVSCAFEDSFFDALVGPRSGWTSSELINSLDLKSRAITQTMQILQDEALAPGFASGCLIEASATALLVHLARYLRKVEATGSNEGGRLTPSQLRLIDDYLESLSGCSATIGDIARICGLSTRHLQRKIVQTTGLPVSAYVWRAQLLRAKRLLARPNLPLKEIGYQLGFNSQSSFSYAFRKAVGQTPSAFRKELTGRW